MTTKNEAKDIASNLVPSPGYIFIQTAMLFIVYGLKYNLPWWVKWFPSLVYGFVLAFILDILGIMLIVEAVKP